MNALLMAALIALVALGAWRAASRLRRGGGCCGEHEAAPKRAPVADRNKAHYPHEVRLDIGGMTCDNCARRVENALNRLDGAWATVRFDTRSARVRLKDQPEEAALRAAVSGAGYVVTGIARIR